MRYFGAEGLRARLKHHCDLATTLAGWVDSDPDFTRVAPVPFSVVCFRATPRGLSGDAAAMDALNARMLERVNKSGDVFLSHTKLDGRYVIRLAIGHLKTEEKHVRRAWDLLRDALRVELS
jgi:aromatic-L-amino-acid decarboxylase